MQLKGQKIKTDKDRNSMAQMRKEKRQRAFSRHTHTQEGETQFVEHRARNISGDRYLI